MDSFEKSLEEVLDRYNDILQVSEFPLTLGI
ncbi:uncharacterized protein Eint_091465 [Encephalitozoon intestinalis ATCC 50506]|uniref:Uncharacterized protein n=1 Tax=Encephalitozoon intestinalis (strain ATCC 50506) TaxID=876142 RepID=W8PGU2_ENCIT|nr:uncharacterized protein Eint_091465 [Encephalitozoon intestinalis ATCC 50506]AHL30151.1 hypothetical protein Eint_091465 [Encephalitozoon intestinalis ATCC 50506]UTX46082.1 hypothetical protein GPK93_09g16690 [Encephalitozoon intestinalis]